MPATLYLRAHPRAFYLVTDTHALIFRQPDAKESKAARSVVVAEFLSLDEVDTRGLIKASRSRTVEGVLGVTSVPSERSPIPEIFLLLVSISTPLPTLLPTSPHRPCKVSAVEFHSLTSSFWDTPDLQPSTTSALPYDIDLDDPYHQSALSGSSTQSTASNQGLEHPCTGMRKYLESGSFFYADNCSWDITTRMGQDNWLQRTNSIPHPLETFDHRFTWNSTILQPLLSFRTNLPLQLRQELDDQALLLPVIQGFTSSHIIPTGNWTSENRPEVASLGLISRLSWKRAGARFRTRGIDDDGQVANFVETELILAMGGEGVCLSFVQVRGSVPLFWQQPSTGMGTLQQRVEITRPPQASQPAFDKHFLELLENYHSIHAINLLGQKDAEAMLSQSYTDHLKSLQSSLSRNPDVNGSVELTPYDFHAAVKVGGNEAVRYDIDRRLKGVKNSAESFGWTAIDCGTGEVIEEQQGVFRTNCLDCLDRTNVVQDVISSLTLTRFLASVTSPLINSSTLWAAHRELWADNGDRLSKIYAGTGAINTSATRSGKKTFAGLLSDATKSVGRAYITNFQDKGKQQAIDMLLGMMAGQRPVILFDPISESVQSALHARLNEYSRPRNVIIFSGTWNLNGKAPDEALDAWLFPPTSAEPDIYMIAFQEIVELTAGQILQTDPAKKRVWEKYIMNTFAMRGGQKSSDYILYRSEQLVGTALIVIVKSSVAKDIRAVESATKKTGLQGLSGNKGGVGIRLDLCDSSICLMTCHLAAGHGNVTERNADYKTISSGLKFLRGKMIDDHEIVIWAADFNYRIALSNLDVRDFAETDALDPLLGADQLQRAMDDGDVFAGYDEGPIRFRPTYKYDNGTDDYDTSEKARIPAWTDRVLFKGSALRLKDYNRADLRTSDHRPVYAIFDATIRELDHAKKDKISKDILHDIRFKAEADTGGLDGAIQSAVDGGGVTRITEKLTASGSRTSSQPQQPPVRQPTPRLPPRPTMSVSEPDRPQTASPRPTRAPTLEEAMRNATAVPSIRKPPPPVPTRVPVPSVSTIVPSPSKRPPRPIPRHSAASLITPARPASPSSPILTPSSTGDFVVIPRKPPPLPVRVALNTPDSAIGNGDGRHNLENGGSKPPSVAKKAPPLPMWPKPLALNDSTEEGAKVSPKKVPPVVPKKPEVLRVPSATG